MQLFVCLCKSNQQLFNPASSIIGKVSQVLFLKTTAWLFWMNPKGSSFKDWWVWGMFACFYNSIYLAHACVQVMWFLPCDTYYDRDDDADLYSSDDHSNQDVLKLLPIGHHVQFTEVSLLTLHTGEPHITPKQQDHHWPKHINSICLNPSAVHPVYYLLQYMTCACLWVILAHCQAIFNLTTSMHTKAAVDFSTGHCSAPTDSAH